MNWYFALLPALSDWYTATGAGDHILRGIQTLRSPKCGSLWGIQCPVRLHVRFPRRSLSRGGGLGCGHHLSVARHASPQLARLWPPGAKVSCRNKLLLLANWSLISLLLLLLISETWWPSFRRWNTTRSFVAWRQPTCDCPTRPWNASCTSLSVRCGWKSCTWRHWA